MADLDRLSENARRYESWRGGRSTPAPGETGADVMRQLLRQQVMTWVGVAVTGVVLIVGGFVVS